MKHNKAIILSCLGFVLICIFSIILIFLSKYNVKQRVYILSDQNQIKVVFFSDIHIGVGKGEKWLEKIVERVNKEEPDIIIIGGDFIESKNSPTEELEPLKRLKSKYGTFAVMGNHDYYNEENVKNKCSELGLHLLINEVIYIDNTELSITGVDDLWNGKKYKDNLIPQNSKYDILISHNPAILYDIDYVDSFDLILSGHTHAGQGNIPLVNYSLYWPFDDLERKYRTGSFEITDNTTLIISSGVGENAMPLRIFAQPTIEIIKI